MDQRDQCDPDAALQAIHLSDSQEEKKKGPTNVFLYAVFDHGWYDFQLKYWCFCFGFCRIQVTDPASRDLWCEQHWHVSCCNPWKIKGKKFLNLISHLPLQWRLVGYFKMFKRNKFLRKKERLLHKQLCTKWNFILREKENLILCISGNKKKSFSTQEAGKNMIFPQHLQIFHDILRTEKDGLSVLQNIIRWYFM